MYLKCLLYQLNQMCLIHLKCLMFLRCLRYHLCLKFQINQQYLRYLLYLK